MFKKSLTIEICFGSNIFFNLMELTLEEGVAIQEPGARNQEPGAR